MKKILIICQAYLSKERELNEDERQELYVKSITNKTTETEDELLESGVKQEEYYSNTLIFTDLDKLFEVILLEDKIQIGTDEFTYIIKGGIAKYEYLSERLIDSLRSQSNTIINLNDI